MLELTKTTGSTKIKGIIHLVNPENINYISDCENSSLIRFDGGQWLEVQETIKTIKTKLKLLRLN